MFVFPVLVGFFCSSRKTGDDPMEQATFQRKWGTMTNPEEADALIAVLTFIYNRFNRNHPDERVERQVSHKMILLFYA